MSLRRIADGVSSWIEVVAEAIIASIGWLRSARRVQLIEADGDAFSILVPGADAKSGSAAPPFRLLNGDAPAALPADVAATLAAALRGSQVELVLRSDQFLFRPLELPKRAAEFLDGIVRAQIDRLTPWSAANAVFGWTQPADAPNDRISLTVVATARARIAPYLQALSGLGANAIVVSALPQGGPGGAAPIRVFEQGARGALDVARVRRALLVVLAVTSLTAGLAVTTAQILGEDLETQQRDLARRIAERRVALAIGRDTVSGATSALRALERRKHETAASVMVLEALSQVLPDHTHVTELRVEGDKLQIIGITREAPSLIRLMEQSPHFTRATFFAPTTRSPGDPGERFHIEARIKPVFVTGL
jgi:general secretion pathway protein L